MTSHMLSCVTLNLDGRENGFLSIWILYTTWIFYIEWYLPMCIIQNLLLALQSCYEKEIDSTGN